MPLDLDHLFGRPLMNAVRSRIGSASPSAASPSTSSEPPAVPMPAPALRIETEDNTAHGSAKLLHTADNTLTDAVAPLSSCIVMGSNVQDGRDGYLWDLDKHPAHAMTFGPTRIGGKGTSAIIPGLITYTAGSTFTIDPKGENAWTVAQHLRDQGKRVVIMDPWDEVNRRYGSKVGVVETLTRFNPLASLDPNSDDFADDVGSIADALVITNEGPAKHFDDSARELVAGCIAAVVETAPTFATLGNVRDMITAGPAALASTINRIIAENPDSLAARKLRRFAENTGNEVQSIQSTAETQTAFLDSITLQKAMETEPEAFDLAELATSRVALFVVLPVDKLETHGRWLRLIVTLAIRAIARQDTPPKKPVLFLLDEMGTIGKLSMVENAYGLMAGLGIRLWGFFQDLVQLQGFYPRTWETFISNSSIIQILKAHDATTSEYVSRYMGNSTVNAKTGAWTYKQVRWPIGEQQRIQAKREAASREFLREKYSERQLKAKQPPNSPFKTWEEMMMARFLVSQMERDAKEGRTPQYKTEWVPDEQLMARPLMDPDEVRRLPDPNCLLLIPGGRPVMQFRTVYYKHPLFTGRFRHNPYFARSTATVPPAAISAALPVAK